MFSLEGNSPPAWSGILLLFFTASPPLHHCFILIVIIIYLVFFFFFCSCSSAGGRGRLCGGIKKKWLDPLAFQQAPNQKRHGWRLLLYVESALISSAALWPDLHLIKSSVFISFVPLSFVAKKKKPSLCFCSTPGGPNRVTFRFAGIMHFSSRKDKTRMDTRCVCA